MRFNSYYAEASCTAGGANFITGELPIRTGMRTVGQAGAPIGIPAHAVTIATVLKGMDETGQFGKNHLGNRNKYLPTVHAFDEFWGYLYHLDAHPLATTTDDPTVDARWGKVGKQKIEAEGPLPPHPIAGIK